MKALDYLRALEWSMGNGQCPDCLAANEKWVGHPCHREAASVGHKPGCPLAAALVDLGAQPLMLGAWTTERTQAEYVEARAKGERARTNAPSLITHQA